MVSESAGYIGYYGRVTLYDYPGLTSPGALSALEELSPERRRPLLVGMSELTNSIRPGWIVARTEKWDAFRTMFPETAARYELDREFSVSPSESELRFGGVEYASYDRVFLVLHRVRPGVGP